MCGIAGIHSGYQKELVTEMLDAQRHRGPDGQGVYEDEVISLGQNRLAVVSSSMHTIPYERNNLVIVFNGEITNYLKLKKSLKDWNFQTDTDTEVLLAAFSKWGERCVDFIDGMYSFFIWNKDTGQGFAARDPFGVKPFFYSFINSRLLFASEIKPIVKVLPSVTISDEAIIETLIAPYFSGALETPFEEVKVLPPGHSLIVDGDKIKIKEFYHFKPQSDIGSTSNLETVLSQVVTDSLIAFKKPGLFLSGGLDSSLLAIEAQNQKQFIIDYKSNRRFTYEGESIINSYDTTPAIEVSKLTQGQRHIIEANEEKFREVLEKTAKIQSSIVVWPQEVSQQILSTYASKFCKSVLVGDAADETHFGYFFLLNEAICKTPKNVFDYFGVPTLQKKWNYHINLLSKKYIRLCSSQGYDWNTNPQLAVSYLISRLWSGRLLLNGDVHTMSNSLEARVPFANRAVLDIAQRLKLSDSFKDGIEKSHLRKIASTKLPNSISDRKKSALPCIQNINYKVLIAELSIDSYNFVNKYVDMRCLMKQESSMLHFRVLMLGKWYENIGKNYE